MFRAFYFQDNEVAAVEPPPVVPYPPDRHSKTASSATQGFHQPTHPNPHDPSGPYHRHTTNPDPQYQPDPRYPAPTDPRFPSYSERLNQPDGRYSVHTTQQRPTYPDTRYPVSTPRRPPVPQTPPHRHSSGPGVRVSSSEYSRLCAVCYRQIKSYHWARFCSSTSSP